MGVNHRSTDPVIFGFVEYRAYMKAVYDSRREASSIFSYRFMSQRLDVDAGQLARILQGKLHLPQRALAAAIDLFRLERREAAYFEELLRLGRAKSPDEQARILERLEALKVPPPQPVPPEQAAFYGNWHHSVVRSLAALESIPQDPASIADSCRPRLTRKQASESLELLERLGLLQRGIDDRLHASQAHLTPDTAIPSELLRAWHAQAMEQARRSLAETPPEERDVSTMTVAVSASDLPKVRDWISDLRRQARALSASTTDPDRVFQVNMQFFPVAKRARSRKAG